MIIMGLLIAFVGGSIALEVAVTPTVPLDIFEPLKLLWQSSICFILAGRIQRALVIEPVGSASTVDLVGIR